MAQPYSRALWANHHDSGSQAAYDYWLENDYQWGSELSQNVGPAGFLNYPQLYSGFLVIEKLIFHLIITSILVALVIYYARYIPSKKLRWGWLAIVSLFSGAVYIWGPWTNSDAQMYLLVTLIGYHLFSKSPIWQRVGLIIVLALLSYAKGILFFMGLATITLTICYCLLEKRYQDALFYGISYPIISLIWWTILGQSIPNITAFWFSTFQFSSGYSIAFSRNDFILGLPIIELAVLSYFAFFMLWKWYRYQYQKGLHQKYALLLIGAWEGFIAFVIWKHAIISTDLHFFYFMQFIVCALFLFLYVPSSLVKNFSAKKIELKGFPKHLFEFLITICIIFCFLYKGSLIDRFYTNIRILANPKDYLSQLQEDLDKTIQSQLLLPQVKEIVGDQPITQFGSFPAPMLYNDLDYHVMPSTISFAATNLWIAQKDKEFLNGANTPDYILFTLDAPHNRFTPQNSPLALLEILGNYDPVWYRKMCPEEIDYMLLERRKDQNAVIQTPTGAAKTYQLDEWIEVPDTSSPIRVVIDMPVDLSTRLFTLAFKPPSYRIEYEFSEGKRDQHKFTSSMGSVGFLVAPLIRNQKEFLAAYSMEEYQRYQQNQSTKMQRIKRFRVICTNYSMFCSTNFELSYEKVDGLRLGRIDMNGKYLF